MKTDAQVQQDVLAELKWEPSVDAERIRVEVAGGRVTLAGQVSSYAEKWDAEHIAQRVAGVKALSIEMDVALPEANRRSDDEIARAAEYVLQWTTYLPKDAVKVAVENGRVTLSGDVDWEYQRQAASRGVRYLMGVTGVSDLVAIKPKVSLSAIKADIEAALKRRAKADAQNIAVEVRGAEVKLTGTVHSWPERELARHSAWSTPGVLNVVDNLTVVQ